MTDRAFIAGIENYPNIPDPATGAQKSAASIAQLLRDSGFACTDVQIPLQESLSRSVILNGLSWLTGGGLGRGDRMCFYFMGHGVTGGANSGNAYLAAYEFDGNTGSTADLVSTSEVAQAMANMPPGVEAIVVLDACSSGALPPIEDRDKGRATRRSEEQRRFPVGNVLARFVKALCGVNAVVLAACEADEWSNADIIPPNTEPTGVFTELLVREIRNSGAKALASIANAVCGQVCDYVHTNSNATSQHPPMGGVRAIASRPWMQVFSDNEYFDTTYVPQPCKCSYDAARTTEGYGGEEARRQ